AKAHGIPNAVIGGIDPRAPTAPGASAPGIVGLLNSGILNPFSLTQTPEALAGLEAVSARGVKLYGGKYETRQFDASISGSLFRDLGHAARKPEQAARDRGVELGQPVPRPWPCRPEAGTGCPSSTPRSRAACSGFRAAWPRSRPASTIAARAIISPDRLMATGRSPTSSTPRSTTRTCSPASTAPSRQPM